MTTEERFEALERALARAKRRNRWLLAAVGLAVAVLAAAWLATEAAGPALAQDAAKPFGPIRATAFVFVDDKGRERGKLEMGELGSVLNLSDENGKSRVALVRHRLGTVSMARQGSGTLLSAWFITCLSAPVGAPPEPSKS